MLASAAAKFCSQQAWSEPYQLSSENEISKQDQLRGAAPFSFPFDKQQYFKNKK